MGLQTFDAIEMAMLALIGVLTPTICVAGIGWAYRMEQRGPTKEKRSTDGHASERGAAERRHGASV